MKKQLLKEVREFIKFGYYVRDDGKNTEVWYPFKKWGKKELDTQINQDTQSLMKFLDENKKLIELYYEGDQNKT